MICATCTVLADEKEPLTSDTSCEFEARNFEVLKMDVRNHFGLRLAGAKFLKSTVDPMLWFIVKRDMGIGELRIEGVSMK